MKERPQSVARLLLICSLLLVGCNVGPKYKKPALTLPKEYSLKLQGDTKNDIRSWWQAFNNPTLEKLIQEGIQNNPDLKIALEKIIESRNMHRIDVAKILPEIDLFGAIGRANLGDGILTQGKLFNNVSASIIALDTLWEIDVWGKMYRTQKASHYTFEAQIEEMHDVLVILVAEIAQTYITLCSQEEKIRLVQETDNLNKEILKLYKDSFTAGLDNRQIPLEQTTSIDLVETQLIDLKIEQRKNYNKLAFLLGKNPDQLDLNLESITEIPHVEHEAPIDEPYELLRRRPDIRKAEKKLKASYEQIGAAVAEWFPKISLLAFLGRPSISSCQFPPGQAKLWFAGPLFDWPILDFGRIYFNIQVQESSQRQALIQYERTVLNALQEVENWLFAYVNNNYKLRLLESKQESENKRYALTQKLFASGLESRITQLTNQIRMNEIAYELLDAQENVALSFVSLYKSLGGGW